MKAPQKPTPSSASGRPSTPSPTSSPSSVEPATFASQMPSGKPLGVEPLGEPVAQRRADGGAEGDEQRRHGSTTGALGGRPESRSARSTATRQAASVPTA